MADPWATVVVPIYNTARWLPAALESIDHQICRPELEIILIDDGSTDDSGRIAREYAERAPGVHYVRQDNAGLGAARNHGLHLATGRYLAFLDSDDIYPEDGLHTLLRLGDEYNAPVVVGDMQGLPPRPNPAWRRELVTGLRVINALGEAPDLVGNPSACNKVFQREFVELSGVEFSEGTAFEDVLFTVPLLLRATPLVLSPHLAYLYRRRIDGSSIMDSRSQPAKIMQHLTIVERLKDEATGAPAEARHAVQRWIAYMQLHYAWRASIALDDEQLTEFTRRMSALFEDIPVEVVSEFVGNPEAGLRAAAVYEHEPASVRSPKISGPIVVRNGQAYANHAHFARYQDLLRLTRLTANITSLRGGTRLVVEGNLHLPNFAGEIGETRPDLLLEIGDALVRRPLVLRKVTSNRVYWSCDVPVDPLGAGHHRLRVVVRDHGREYVMPRGSDLPAIRPAAVGSGRSAWIAPVRGEPRLVVADNSVSALLRNPHWLARGIWLRGRRALGAGARLAVRRVRTRVAPATTAPR